MWKPIILDVECIVCNKSLQKINHDPEEAERNMGKIACRRSRTPNWSLEEKKYLLELIKERKDVVVTKNNNGPNYSEEKDVAWNEILRELSQKFGNKFSVSSIKKVKTQWQNMKRIAREEIALVGPLVDKFTKQTLEVCTILDMVKDGVLKRDDENLNDTIMPANIEIKTERLDEDPMEPCFSNTSITEPMVISDDTLPKSTITATSHQPDFSESSNSEEASEEAEMEIREEPASKEPKTKSVAVMTEQASIEDINNMNPFHRQLQEFFSYSVDEKQIKMESLKEERRVIKAMRETAELNKIIAEQKLKHVLWLKKQDMA